MTTPTTSTTPTIITAITADDALNDKDTIIIVGKDYTHVLTTKEVEYLFRERLNSPTIVGAVYNAVWESLEGLGYSKEYNYPKTEDFFISYDNLSLQDKIFIWSKVVFGGDSIYDKQERAYRFGEEAIELLQSCGITKDALQRLINYVYSREKGEFAQEVGGVMTTLCVLASIEDVNINIATKCELDRIWMRIDQIREKQKNKPVASSPVPGKPDIELKALTREDKIKTLNEAILKIVEERTFIKSSELGSLTSDVWVGIEDFDFVRYLDVLVEAEALKVMTITTSGMEYRNKEVYYSPKVTITSI